MSSLSASFNKYKSELADTAARNLQYARPSSSAPPRSSTPTPAVSAAAAAEKRSHQVAVPSQPPGATGTAGKELMTHVLGAVKYLKEKNFQAVPFDQLISYLSLPVDLQKNIPLIKRALQKNERVIYLSKTESGIGKECFKYRSLHPVTNGDELVAHLHTLETSQGISVNELKDGWPDCGPTIDRLESEGQILVARKKDNTPKAVWADSPSFYPIVNPSSNVVSKVDPDFIDFWSKTKLPASETEIRGELERARITVTSAVREVRKADVKKKERKRPVRKNGKTTNAHMVGILKDYSNRKPA